MAVVVTRPAATALGILPPDAFRGEGVLVTGCTGLLGSWLTRRLLELDARVVGVVRDYVPTSSLLCPRLPDGLTVVSGDVRDRDLLERALGEHEISTVFHLAAQTIVGIAAANPISTFETNVAGTWCLLEAVRRSPGVRRVVVASSDKAYGAQDELPYTESMPLRGEHPYDVSKSCADLVARAYHVTYDSPVAVTRCANLYGGGDLNFNRIVPGVIRDVLEGRRPRIRSDGSMVRDYLYVEDAVDAYLITAHALTDTGMHGESFNFSADAPMTVLELTRAILERMGSSLEPDVRNEARHEIQRQYLSADKARRTLGWVPRFDLGTGLDRTIAWYARFLERPR